MLYRIKMNTLVFVGFIYCVIGAVSVSAIPKLIEGDIVWDKKLEKITKDPTVHNVPGKRVKRSAFAGIPSTHEHRWKNGLIPYMLSTSLQQHARNAIEQAITQVEKYTCVRFTPRNGQKDYVEFIFDNGCYSSIGRQKGGQVISVGVGCEFLSNVVHEILHALGMFHEQTRIDRDLYVHVLWWNVRRGAERNFDIYHHGVIDSFSFPYDFKSATHYYNKDFSKNGADTIQAIGNPRKELGNHRGMSKMDMRKINIFYKCYQKKRMPKKAPCRDRFFLCHRYMFYCSNKWFGQQYCQKSCGICLS